ncbi:hypothetical protein Pmani_025664 [Petrolisthes manimaculis]|uniref:Uncharacterized protein n=1 Tax=Petrolisthes manimaculis TaxID=1843537 RepID=A0AAE1NZD0_9EUCA|nr:hypothetical protein Pmani_029442 [Petrolisthes manimaculis]KAK4302234.1 hypothetical protein Pmani_025664 [Petrolisthes manimaculis]
MSGCRGVEEGEVQEKQKGEELGMLRRKLGKEKYERKFLHSDHAWPTASPAAGGTTFHLPLAASDRRDQTRPTVLITFKIAA